MPETLPNEIFQQLHTLFQDSILGEDVLRAEDSRTLWNKIFNSAVLEKDKKHCDSGVALYSSTTQLLTRYMGRDHGKVFATWRRAALHVWLGFLEGLTYFSK